MRKLLIRMICVVICCYTTLFTSAQINKDETTLIQFFKEGSMAFKQKAYTSAIPALEKYLQLSNNKQSITQKSEILEAAYMLACANYELQHPKRIEILHNFLKQHPDTPHGNRINALIASSHFFNEDYKQALDMFTITNLDQLDNVERDDMTYRMAYSHLQIGNISDAAIWFETLRNTSEKYSEECSYYLSYIRYTQKRYEEALNGFLSLQKSSKYNVLTPYYIAEIYLQEKQYDKAEATAQEYLSKHPNQQHEAEMFRILGTAQYQTNRFQEAMESFKRYQAKNGSQVQRRDAIYMLGLSCFYCGAYSQVPNLLGYVTKESDDVLTQNAYLHMGLAYLQMADRNNARMAFEQAAFSNMDMDIKEQAAYNYAVSIHETAYSAFGESITAFENFLNEFPASSYTDQVSKYLVDEYMNTRNYETALQSINRISKPSNTILEAKQNILFQLGTQSFANAMFKEANEYLTQSITLGKYNQQTKANAFYWLGEVAYRQENTQEATQYFKNYLSTTSKRDTQMYALAYYNLGYIAFNEKDYITAEKHLSKFTQSEKLQNYDLLADAYNRIGDCHLHSRQFEQAKNYYQNAKGLNTSTGAYSLHQLALIAGIQKEYSKKIELLNQLSEQYPRSSYIINALYEKGRSYIHSNNNQEAILSFEKLLKNYPDNPISRKAAAEIGLLYYQDNNFDKAIKAYKRVIVQYPESEEARLAIRDLKNIYVETNRVHEISTLAIEIPNIHFEVNEQDSLTYIAAERLFMKQETENAKNAFTYYLQSYPNGTFKIDAHYKLCCIAKAQKNENNILTHTNYLLEYPNSPYTEEALLMRSEILYNQKHYNDALNDYKALQACATSNERRQIGTIGILYCAQNLEQEKEVVQAATTLLEESNLLPELRNKALYYRAKAYLKQQIEEKAYADLKLLANDTRTLYGAESKYLLAQYLYDKKDLKTAEQEVLTFISQSTPHTYWLARSFILLADIYIAMDKKLDARQYLLSLRKNYQANDEISNMIEERLNNLNKTH